MTIDNKYNPGDSVQVLKDNHVVIGRIAAVITETNTSGTTVTYRVEDLGKEQSSGDGIVIVHELIGIYPETEISANASVAPEK